MNSIKALAKTNKMIQIATINKDNNLLDFLACVKSALEKVIEFGVAE